MGSNMEIHQAQIERILEKLSLARSQKLSCFGSASHGFVLAEPWSEAELRQFEEQHEIHLPQDYRDFLRLAGSCGAGPYYGLEKLSSSNTCLREDDPPAGWLAKECPLQEEPEANEAWEKLLETSDPFFGTIELGTQGCSYMMLLVVTGSLRGRVLYVDLDGQHPFVTPDRSFLDWYERWLDELLGGYETSWFGFSWPGNEAQLFEAFDDPSLSEGRRALVARSFVRLPGLSPLGEKRISEFFDHADPLLRKAACQISRHFQLNAYADALLRLCGDPADEVRKSANYCLGELEKADPRGAEQRLLQTLKADPDDNVAYSAFQSLNKKGLLSRQDFLDLLRTNPHSSIRSAAVHEMAWTLGETAILCELLADSSSSIRLQAASALLKLRAPGAIPAAIEQLKVETSLDSVDCLLRILGNDPAQAAVTFPILISWLEKGDDFSQLAVVDGLCRLGDRRAIPYLRQMLKRTERPTRGGPSGASNRYTISEMTAKAMQQSSSLWISLQGLLRW